MTRRNWGWLLLAWVVGGFIVIGVLSVNSDAGRANDYHRAGEELSGVTGVWMLVAIIWGVALAVYKPNKAPAAMCPRCGLPVQIGWPSCPRCGYMPGMPMVQQPPMPVAPAWGQPPVPPAAPWSGQPQAPWTAQPPVPPPAPLTPQAQAPWGQPPAPPPAPPTPQQPEWAQPPAQPPAPPAPPSEAEQPGDLS